jgi:hypothetical protein
MRVETHLLDYIGDVKPSEREVLENPDQTTVDSRVTVRDTRVRGDLDLSVHRRGTRLDVGHTSTLKDIKSALTLLQDQVVGFAAPLRCP